MAVTDTIQPASNSLASASRCVAAAPRLSIYSVQETPVLLEAIRQLERLTTSHCIGEGQRAALQEQLDRARRELSERQAAGR